LSCQAQYSESIQHLVDPVYNTDCLIPVALINNMLRSLFLIMLTLCSQSVLAQARYVTDEFEIMMRTGPSVQNKILAVLRSGTELNLVQADAGNGYSQVQTGNGEVGYALTRYLVATPSARSRVASLEKQIEQLRSEPKELANLLATSQEDNQLLIQQNAEMAGTLNTVQSELSRIKKISGEAVNLATQNDQLEKEVQQLLLQLDDVRIQNEDLKDQSDRMQNMLGAGLVLLGLFLGWVLSISGRRGRNSWGS